MEAHWQESLEGFSSLPHELLGREIISQISYEKKKRTLLLNLRERCSLPSSDFTTILHS
jgi:hypothetical protein